MDRLYAHHHAAGGLQPIELLLANFTTVPDFFLTEAAVRETRGVYR